MDLAEIGLRADSSELKTASAALDRFGREARGAEVATDKFRRTEEKTSRATDKLRRDLGETSSAFQFMRGAIVGVAASLAAAFGGAYIIREFIGNTNEAALVQSQLQAALTSTQGASGQTMESLNEMATSLQKVSNFGDEAIGTAQSILLTFTKIGGETFPRATQAVLDLSQRMGMDLSSAALQLGKALNNPTLGLTMLNRAGIQFSESQKELIKDLVETNRLTEAQGIILEEVERQFGGSALAARETLGGALTSLANAWGDLFEVSGPATENLRSSIEGLIAVIQSPAFMEFANLIGVVIFTGITALAQAFAFLGTVIPPIVDALITLSPLLIAVFGPIVLSSVMGLAAAVGTTLLGAFTALWAVILANPLTVIIAAIVTILSYFVDWEIAIRNLIQVWALFMYEWNSFWGDAQGAQYWIKVGLDAGNTIKELKATAEQMKVTLTEGVDLGGEEASGKLEAAMTRGGDKAAGAIERAMSSDQAAAIYDNLNGRVIKPLGDTLVSGGDYIHNQVTGAITKGTTEGTATMSSGITGAGEGAGKSMQDAIVAGGSKVGAQIYDSVESAFATLAPIFDVIAAFQRQARADISLTYAEAQKARAEAALARAEADDLKAGGRPNRGGSASSGMGSSGGGSGRSNEIVPMFNWQRNPTPSAVSETASRSTPIVSASETVATQPPLTVVNVWDPENMITAMNTMQGRQALINFARANRDELVGILGLSQ